MGNKRKGSSYFWFLVCRFFVERCKCSELGARPVGFFLLHIYETFKSQLNLTHVRLLSITNRSEENKKEVERGV